MTAGHGDQLDLGVGVEFRRDPQRCHGGATGDGVPALLEGVGDSQRLGHGFILPGCQAPSAITPAATAGAR